MNRLLVTIFALSAFLSSFAQTSFWLRFTRNGVTAEPSVEVRNVDVLSQKDVLTVEIAANELRENWTGLPVVLCVEADSTHADGYFRIEKRENDLLRSPQDSPDKIYITASAPSGLLYAAYQMLRSQAMGDGCLCKTLGNEDVLEQQPAYAKRIIKADLAEFPDSVSPRQFARLCASVGINGIVLTGKSSAYGVPSDVTDVMSQYQIELHNSYNEHEVVTIDIRQSNPQHIQYIAPTWQIATTDTHNAIEAVLDMPSITCQPFSILNIYAFGRKAWMPAVSPETVAFEWLSQTFTENPLFVLPVRDMLMRTANPTSEDLERFVSTWQQSARDIDPDVHSLVEECLLNQYLDSLNQ